MTRRLTWQEVQPRDVIEPGAEVHTQLALPGSPPKPDPCGTLPLPEIGDISDA